MPFYKKLTNKIGIDPMENVENKFASETLDQECSICFETFHNSIVSTLECGHKFHYGCIHEWVSSKNTCPLCRMPVTLTFYGNIIKTKWCFFKKKVISYKITINDDTLLLKDMSMSKLYSYPYCNIRRLEHNCKILKLECYNKTFNLKLKKDLCDQLFTILKNKCSEPIQRQTQNPPQTAL